MKKLIALVFISLFFTATGLAQEKSLSFKINGGIWIGFNKSTTFIGLPGPKLTTTFPISEKMKLEIGVNGIPGLILGKDPKAGLCLGSTLTLHTKWKVRPVIGMMFLKTSSWQTLYGVGFLF